MIYSSVLVYFDPLPHSSQKKREKRKEKATINSIFAIAAQRGRILYAFFVVVVIIFVDFSRLYSATGYAIEPRLKQIQDEDAGHIFREPTSAS